MKRRKAAAKPAPPSSDKAVLVAICVVLAVASMGIYSQAFHFGFVAYDDDQYVYNNAMVKAGLTPSGIAWALTTFHYANWHPLTWLSYLIDVELFGLAPEPIHAGNILLHAANTVLLFLALFRLTRERWRAVIVAAIFALHPLHVESVAWISERKDVLSTFFGIIALLLYVRYVERPSMSRQIPLALIFAFSLMAKPMLVTLPFVLLLLDYWPLNRPRTWKLVIEKLPLFALSAAASVLTFAAQKSYGAVASVEHIPLLGRMQNAAVAYVTYIAQSIWPAKLGVLYPVAPASPGITALALLVLVGVTAAVLTVARSLPYLFTGWFWYLGTLVPVIGIVQVGLQSRADRYMYVPLIGLSIAIVWSAADWLQSRPSLQQAGIVVVGVILALFAMGAWRQVGYWGDSRTLFERTLAVTDRNAIIRNNLGVVLALAKDSDGAVREYEQAIAINPDYFEAHANLGHELLRAGKFAAARTHLLTALRLKPQSAIALADMGFLEAVGGNYAEAIRHLSESLSLEPNEAETHSNLCFVLQHTGRFEEAVAQCREALRLKPNYPDAQFNLKNALERRLN